jgi:hypothetical protein
MVDYTAIKATSETLKTLLETDMDSLDSSDKIIIGRPKNEDGRKTRMYLFLFQVVENKHLKNDDNSRLWLDLFYLLIPYDKDEIQAHVTLGDAMRVFYDHALIHPHLRLKSKRNGTEVDILEKTLGDAVEKIKITPHPMTLEELSNIWNPLKEDLRLSVAYQVSVVQIDSDTKKRYPPPVRMRNISPIPFQRPQIFDVQPQRVHDGEILTVTGCNFSSENTVVMIGEEECIPLTIADHRITVAIPSSMFAGPHLVEIAIKPLPGKKFGFTSNQGVFILVPILNNIVVTGTLGNELITVMGHNLWSPGPPSVHPLLLISDQYIELNKDTMFLFSVEWDRLKDYLREDMWNEKVTNTTLMKKFSDNNCPLSPNAIIFSINDNQWKISDGSNAYLLEHIDSQFKIYSLTTIKIKGEFIAENIDEGKLPISLCPIRIKVNSVESTGSSIGTNKEQVWFYDKTRPSFKEKITSEEITMECQEYG